MNRNWVVTLLAAFSFPTNSPADPQRDAPPPRIEPGLSVLPANHLKFYLHFFRPMERGEAFRHLRLVEIDPAGEEIQAVREPFREVELWDETFTRLTLWLHPGRQKPGVNLNVEIGPVLEEGKRYRLEVARSWRDEGGRPLAWRMAHEFLAGPSDEAQPDPRKWRIRTDEGSVRVKTGEALDPESLKKRVVVRRAGEENEVAVVLEADGDGFAMRASGGLAPGDYRLIVDPRLEDLAGNSVARPFNRDLSKAGAGNSDEADPPPVVLPFEVPLSEASPPRRP